MPSLLRCKPKVAFLATCVPQNSIVLAMFSCTGKLGVSSLTA